MDEEKETQSPQEPTEGQTKEAPTEEPSAKSVIEIATELKESIAKENDRREELLRREEELHAKRMLGGRSEAGQSQQLSEEDKIKQDAKKFWAGTEVEKAIEKYG